MLKKSFLIITLFIGSSLVASESYKYYVGAGFSTGSGSQTRSYSSGGEAETEYDSSATALKIGMKLKNGNRVELSFDNISADRTGGNTFVHNIDSSDTSSEYSGYGFDYLLLFSKSEPLRPYLTVGFGLYKNNEITGYNTSGEADTASGFALNFGAGVLFSITTNIELEASYKIKAISWNLEDPDTSEQINALYLGANLRF